MSVRIHKEIFLINMNHYSSNEEAFFQLLSEFYYKPDDNLIDSDSDLEKNNCNK